MENIPPTSGDVLTNVVGVLMTGLSITVTLLGAWQKLPGFARVARRLFEWLISLEKNIPQSAPIAPPSAQPTNGNGNGNGHALVNTAITIEASARQSLEKRMEDYMERADAQREEDIVRWRSSEDSWLRAYKDSEGQKREALDTIKRFEGALNRVNRTLADHEKQIVDIQDRNEKADKVMDEILQLVREIKDKAA